MQTRTLNLNGSGIRDERDAKAFSDQYFAALREGRATPQVGGRPGSRPRMGAGSSAYPGTPGCAPRQDQSFASRQPCSTEPGCDIPSECGGDILGFHSFGVALFPFAGAVAGVISETPDLQVNSGHACAYKARKFFFEARDASNAFTVAPSLLTSVVVAGEQQLTSSDVANGITSSVFALTCEPLPVGWRRFTNTNQQNLILRFGTYLGPASALQMLGVMWGDEVPR